MKKKFAIIGSGIGGLTAANLFKLNPNFDVKVYEKEKELSLKEGYGIQLGPNSISILNKIKFFASNKENSYLYASLGQLLYLSTLKISTCIVGNSSSGIAEAPYFGVTTINIGSRQKGRPRCPSIIDIRADSDLILKEIKNSLHLPYL